MGGSEDEDDEEEEGREKRIKPPEAAAAAGAGLCMPDVSQEGWGRKGRGEGWRMGFHRRCTLFSFLSSRRRRR